MTSVKLDASVGATWKDMRKHGNYDYSTFKITGETNNLGVTLDKSVKGSEPTSADKFEEFVESLPEESCQYIVYDFRYISTDEAEVNKFLLIIWCPEDASVAEKDKYHAARNAIRGEMVGLKGEYLVSHADDLNYSEIKAACMQ